MEALADATTIADCGERLTEAKACLSTVPSHSARSYWERMWLNRADRFADALCPISRLGASRNERRYIFLDKSAGMLLSKGWIRSSLAYFQDICRCDNTFCLGNNLRRKKKFLPS